MIPPLTHKKYARACIGGNTGKYRNMVETQAGLMTVDGPPTVDASLQFHCFKIQNSGS